MDATLGEGEMAQWVAWKSATDRVWDAVAREIMSATGMSASEFAVLSRVVEGGGRMRQGEIGQLLGWRRPRLSRLLARMEGRGLVARTADGPGRVVIATTAGRDAVALACPAHARAVRAALIGLVPAGSADGFWAAIEAIGSAENGRAPACAGSSLTDADE